MNLGQFSTPRTTTIVGIVAAVLVFIGALVAVADSFIETLVDARVRKVVAEIDSQRDRDVARTGASATTAAADRTALAQETAARITAEATVRAQVEATIKDRFNMEITNSLLTGAITDPEVKRLRKEVAALTVLSEDGYNAQNRTKFSDVEMDELKRMLDERTRELSQVEKRLALVQAAEQKATANATMGAMNSFMGAVSAIPLAPPDAARQVDFRQSHQDAIRATARVFRAPRWGGTLRDAQLELSFDQGTDGLSRVEAAENERSTNARVGGFVITASVFEQQVRCTGTIVYNGPAVSTGGPVVFLFTSDWIRDVSVPRECARLTPSSFIASVPSPDILALRQGSRELARLERLITLGGSR